MISSVPFLKYQHQTGS